MDALSVSPVGPATLSALSFLRPIQSPAVAPAPIGQPAGATTLSIQDLTQSLFLRSLQAATLFPVAEPTTGSTGLLQEATASLLASLNAPQAPADTTTVTTTSTTSNPAVVQAPDTTPSTAPPSAPPLAATTDQPAVQDAFATSLTPDFAAQTALRFGAGVAAQAALATPVGDFGAQLVRDAAQVLRTANLQPRAGGPGPEAFAQAQAAIQRVLRTYETASAGPATQGIGTVDLLA